MRRGFRWLLTIAFILLLPIWLMLLIPKLNGFGPSAINHHLHQENAYPQLSQLLQQSGDVNDSEGMEPTDQALLVLRSALTADYLETKTTEAMELSSEWVTGESDQTPKVSFNDLRDQVVDSFPAAQLQIDMLRAELAQAQLQIDGQEVSTDGFPGLEGDGSASASEIAEILSQTNSLDNFIAGDFTIELQNQLQPIKDAYWQYWIGLPLLGVLLFLMLLGIFFLGTTWHSRTRWTGWVLLIAGLVNAAWAAIFSVAVLKIGLDIAEGLVPGQAAALTQVARAVINALFADFVRLELIMSGVLGGIGLLLLIIAIFVRRSTKPQNSQDKPKLDLTPEAQKPGASKYAHTS